MKVLQLSDGIEAYVERVAELEAALREIHVIATDHREWAIAGRCVTALGPGVPGISAPSEVAYCGTCDKSHAITLRPFRVCEE